ncbi:hypothetical protein Tdes44962_MAKER01098 [Teratosphaeria destructans]|uniref:Attractin/MKLN-like beta-propeller domain-containing protein n=1 Tax=Teratosphaeria destructans TaxID=418781 RepID=A0A9W7VY44_9PEZI|nr:hypothetical protein Tdes44962_MAKER01098 [Teratosphaeria destructans]
MRGRRRLAGVLAVLTSTAASQTLPYNPTRLFLSPNGSLVYQFQPLGTGSAQSQLKVVDLSHSVNTSKTVATTVSASLPFLQDDDLVPYTPVVDSDGSITVIAGNCSVGADGAQVWRYTEAGRGHGTWKQDQTSQQEQSSKEALGGSNFLATGLAFSEVVDGNASDTRVYVFGGMCPVANATADTWVSAAKYSNLMVQLQPDVSASEYDMTLVTAKGPPIAEAGFSITPLAPSYSANTSGQPQTQQQNFVLLGGQTRSAFINMSQVALFSLPQESWSFFSVSQPADANVQPRSGHTAVLSADGSKVIVFGGWVGDVSNAATPQLAVLEVGNAGDGWSWSAPTPSGSGPASGSGIYGHGAAMLPGDVMMINGGYSISTTVSKKVRRDAQTANTQAYLYNMTSNEWIGSYTSPNSLTDQSDSASGASSKSEQVGLGAGIGIGAVILILLVVFYLWYHRRVKHARQERDRALLSQSSDASFGNLERPFLISGPVDVRRGDTSISRFWNAWDGNTGDSTQRTPEMQHNAAGSTGLFVNMPSPTRGLRKGVAGRGYQYHPAPRFDDQRLVGGRGDIPPIAEREDEDAQSMQRGQSTRSGRSERSAEEDLCDAERKLRMLERVLHEGDPFNPNHPDPLRSNPASPVLGLSPGETVKRVNTGSSRVAPLLIRKPVGSGKNKASTPNWVVEPGPSDPLLIDTGRLSPTKTDERTSSTLSEHSQRSLMTDSSITRTMSTRTGVLMAAAMAARKRRGSSPDHTSSSDSYAQTISTGGRKSPFYCHIGPGARSPTSDSAPGGAPRSAGTDVASFTTAKTTFCELQSQGEALLGGRPIFDPDNPYQRALAAHSTNDGSMVPRTSYDRDPAHLFLPRKRQGWVGSLRRALGAMGDRSLSLTSNSTPYRDNPNASTSSSPVRRRLGGAPQRASSDGGALLRQKRGQKDWEDGQWPRYRDDPDPGDWGEPARTEDETQQAEDDWDVEGAAEKRDVQIMFTVPKARLRVVNADMDRASLRSASDSAISRSGSVRTLQHERSMGAIRMRSEGGHEPLPSTLEEMEPGEGASRPVQSFYVEDEKEKLF